MLRHLMLFIGMLPDTNQSRDGTFSLLHSTSKQSVVYAVVTLLQGSTRSCRLYPLETGEEKRDTDRADKARPTDLTSGGGLM